MGKNDITIKKKLNIWLSILEKNYEKQQKEE